LVGPPPGLSAQEWFFDTGNSGEAFAWRYHLLVAGLDPDLHHASVRVAVTSSVGGKTVVPIRQADLWLVSNLPAHQGTPYRLVLERGIPFRNVPTIPDPHFSRPLIGMRTVRRARLRVEVDCNTDTVSVWTPDPPPPTP
jgi:hypothetical protein